MTRDYLNKNDQFLTSILVGAMKEAEKMLERDISKGERKHLKYIRTYIKHYIHEVEERIGKEKARELNVFTGKYECKLLAKTDRRLERVTLEMDDAYDLVEYAIDQNCNCCDGKDAGMCKLHKVLVNCMVPASALAEEMKAGMCEYWISEQEKEKKDENNQPG